MTEHSDQASFFDEIAWRFKNRDDFIPELFFATMNGAWFGGNGARMYAARKREGFKKGISDALYLQPRGPYAYLAIEMKTEKRRKEKNGGLEPEQAEFIEAVNRNGGFGQVCYGTDEAVATFTSYMGFPFIGYPVRNVR